MDAGELHFLSRTQRQRGHARRLPGSQAVQILYSHAGKLWMDTLMPLGGTVRLVRIERGTVAT
jgi:hypothetical protein